jgi:hypothetical protein
MRAGQSAHRILIPGVTILSPTPIRSGYLFDALMIALIADSLGTLPTTGTVWIGLLLGVIVIVGGLTYLPALALGPVAEHFAMLRGTAY